MPMTKKRRDEIKSSLAAFVQDGGMYLGFGSDMLADELRELLDGAEERPRKPVQIAGDPSFGLVVLADDGTLWHHPNESGWYPLPPLPQGEPECQ
jgi:hypothetical protein